MTPAEMAEAVELARSVVGNSDFSNDYQDMSQALVESQQQVAALTGCLGKTEHSAEADCVMSCLSCQLRLALANTDLTTRERDAATLRAEQAEAALAERNATRADVNGMAELLKAAWAKAEPKHNVTLYPVSYDATFADMARAALEVAATERARVVEEIAAWLVERCVSPDVMTVVTADYIRARWGADRDTKPDNTIGARHTIAGLRAALVELNRDVRRELADEPCGADAVRALMKLADRLRTLAGPVAP